jgi:hypothetical protein
MAGLFSKMEGSLSHNLRPKGIRPNGADWIWALYKPMRAINHTIQILRISSSETLPGPYDLSRAFPDRRPKSHLHPPLASNRHGTPIVTVTHDATRRFDPGGTTTSPEQRAQHKYMAAADLSMASTVPGRMAARNLTSGPKFPPLPTMRTINATRPSRQTHSQQTRGGRRVCLSSLHCFMVAASTSVLRRALHSVLDFPGDGFGKERREAAGR